MSTLSIPLRKKTGTKALRQISLDETLLRRMQQHPEVNWSAVARKAFVEALARLETK